VDRLKLGVKAPMVLWKCCIRRRRKQKRAYPLLMAAILICLPTIALCATADQAPTAIAYQLGVGDKIQIDVYDEPDLNVTTTLPESGTISYPFLGDLKITGLTPKQVEQLIGSGLKGSYLIDPKVSVTVLQYRPFYIHGEVKQSGGYPYQPGLSLRKAVSLAGGFTERASQTKITVIREKDNKQKSLLIKLDDLVYPGDTITVEQSFF